MGRVTEHVLALAADEREPAYAGPSLCVVVRKRLASARRRPERIWRAFPDDAIDRVNQCLHLLLREAERGILILNAIAGVDQLPAIEQAAPSILAMVDFQQGHRYADFNPKTDKTATYGLAALVAGGVLAKTGFFKVALAAIIAAKKFVIIGVIAIVAFLKKLFGKKEPLA